MSDLENKEYYIPGDVVMIKHSQIHSPYMIITEIITSKILNKSDSSKKQFMGVRCGWFDKNDVWREHIFSTKDLIKM